MAWPPPTIRTDLLSTDPQQDVHPAHHNDLASGLNDTVDRLVTNLAAIEASSSGGSIGNATWTRVAPATVDYNHGTGFGCDSDGIFTTVGGLILFCAEVYWPGSSGNSRRIIGLSTSMTGAPGAGYQSGERGITGNQVQQATFPYRAGSGTVRLNLFCYQDSGATLAISIRRVTAIRLTHPF